MKYYSVKTLGDTFPSVPQMYQIPRNYIVRAASYCNVIVYVSVLRIQTLFTNCSSWTLHSPALSASSFLMHLPFCRKIVRSPNRVVFQFRKLCWNKLRNVSVDVPKETGSLIVCDRHALTYFTVLPVIKRSSGLLSLAAHTWSWFLALDVT